MERPLDVQQEQVKVNGLKLQESDFHIYETLCTNLGSFSLSIIDGWKDYEVYFNMQQTVHQSELHGERYAHFIGDCSRLMFCFELCSFLSVRAGPI